jgi:Lar family restriction alleviation protein
MPKLENVRECPFCGDTNIHQMREEEYGRFFYQLECYSCLCTGPPETSLDEAIKSWNTRYSDQKGI